MASTIVVTKLDIPSILSETNTKHSSLDQFLLKHRFIDWCKDLSWLGAGHAKYTVKLLFVKLVCFFTCAAKDKQEAVLGLVRVKTDVETILNDITIIKTSFCKSLVELASQVLVIHAVFFVFHATVNILANLRGREIVKLI